MPQDDSHSDAFHCVICRRAFTEWLLKHYGGGTRGLSAEGLYVPNCGGETAALLGKKSATCKSIHGCMRRSRSYCAAKTRQAEEEEIAPMAPESKPNTAAASCGRTRKPGGLQSGSRLRTRRVRSFFKAASGRRDCRISARWRKSCDPRTCARRSSTDRAVARPSRLIVFIDDWTACAKFRRTCQIARTSSSISAMPVSRIPDPFGCLREFRRITCSGSSADSWRRSRSSTSWSIGRDVFVAALR